MIVINSAEPTGQRCVAKEKVPCHRNTNIFHQLKEISISLFAVGTLVQGYVTSGGTLVAYEVVMVKQFKINK